MDEELKYLIENMRDTMKDIKDTMKNVGEHIKTINDNNIYHHTKIMEMQTSTLEKLQILTGKYWWLIISLIIVMLIIMGYKEAIGHFGL